MDSEYNEEFDMFLYEKVGYDRLAVFMQGLYLNPYAATSLREYFATGFTEFFVESEHTFMKKVSPALYQKLSEMQNPTGLDI